MLSNSQPCWNLTNAVVWRPLPASAFCAAFHGIRENSVASQLCRELRSPQQAESGRDWEGELGGF